MKRHVVQCEGCPEPLASLLEQFSYDDLDIEYTLCQQHATEVYARRTEVLGDYLYNDDDAYNYGW